MINKHKAVQEWVQSFLEDNYLYFESTDAYANTRAIVPNYGDFVIRTDIIGAKYRVYNFAFIGYEQIDVGTSDVNANNMQLMDDFNQWLVEQQEAQNFPDFGDNCSEYKVTPLQNMATLATITDDGLAKYMLGVEISYKEMEE